MQSHSAPRLPWSWLVCPEPPPAVLSAPASLSSLWPYGASLTRVTSPHTLLTSALPEAAPLPPAVTSDRSVVTPMRTTQAGSGRGSDGCRWTPAGVTGHGPWPEGRSSAERSVGSLTGGGRRQERSPSGHAVTLKFGVSAILGTDRDDNQEDATPHSATAAAAAAGSRCSKSAAATAVPRPVSAAADVWPDTTLLRLRSVFPPHTLTDGLPFILGR